MCRRAPVLSLAIVLLVWITLGGLLVAGVWAVGPRPRTLLGWSLLVTLGPALVLIHYPSP